MTVARRNRPNKNPPAAPTCLYCGDRPAERLDTGRVSRYRGRPACATCRFAFETGGLPKPDRPRKPVSCRNGRSDRQRWPEDAAPEWDDAVRIVEDAPCD